jgi:hypothetical protein
MAENGGLESLSARQKEELQKGLLQTFGILQQRSALSAALGKTFGGDRDLYAELGYPLEPTFQQFEAMYKRQDIAGRVVDMPPDETWRKNPTVKEIVNDEPKGDTPFVLQYEELAQKVNLYHYLHRVDRLAGIGRFGVLLIGLKDQGTLEEEAGRVNGIEGVTFLAAYDEGSAEVNEIERDPMSERFGQVSKYQLDMGTTQGGETSETVVVDWSRTLHVAEELTEDEIYGRPRLERVYNRMLDIEKVVGGGSEAMWRLIYQGMVLTTKEGYEKSTTAGSEDVTEDELTEFINGFRRILEVEGFDVQFVGGQVVDPTGMFQVILSLIAGETGIPKRMLVGSERGELASVTDQAQWAGVVESRRTNFVEPIILLPFIDRMTQLNVLPEHGDLEFTWQPLFEEAESDQADIARKYSEALQRVAPAGEVSLVVDPAEFVKEYIPSLADHTVDEGQLLEDEREEMEETEDTLEAFGRLKESAASTIAQ